MNNHIQQHIETVKDAFDQCKYGYLSLNSTELLQQSIEMLEQQQKELDHYYEANNRLQDRCNVQTVQMEQQQREIERLKAELKDERFQHNFEKNSHMLTFEGIADKDREIERLNKALDQIHTDSTDAWAAGYALRVQSKALSPKEEETTDVQDDR